jgi:HPt (histidine-containing phosphotransfer) domain-containing protein
MFVIPAPLRKKYVSRRELDLALLIEALKRTPPPEDKHQVQDLSALKLFHKIGHQLAGNARSYDFSSLEQIADRLEGLKKHELHTKGPSLLEDFSQWIQEQKNILQCL